MADPAERIAAVLAGHPEVGQTRVLERGAGQLVAYVSPATAASTGAAGRVAEWAEIFDAVYGLAPAGPDPTLNSAGWTNSHTGAPYQAAEVRDSVEATAARILALPHERVLEVGCGTGMVLARVAPSSRHYVGLDPATEGLTHIRTQLLARDPALAERVRLRTGLAHELHSLAGQQFDLIVLNSVIQYFPSVDYLLDVLDQAFTLLAPGGAVFLGDVRNLALLPQLHASIQRAQAPDLDAAELRGRVLDHAWHEPELMLDPRLFTSLGARLPGLSAAKVLLKHGTARNELNGYRYDVILSTAPVLAPAGQTIVWSGQDLAAVLSHGVVQVLDLPNAHVSSACALWIALAAGGPIDQSTVDEGVDLAAVLAQAGRHIEARWPSSGNPATFDLVASPAAHPDPGRAPATSTEPWSAFANVPAAGSRPRQLATRLRAHLAQHLPPPARPAALIVRDTLTDPHLDDAVLATLTLAQRT